MQTKFPDKLSAKTSFQYLVENRRREVRDEFIQAQDFLQSYKLFSLKLNPIRAQILMIEMAPFYTVTQIIKNRRSSFLKLNADKQHHWLNDIVKIDSAEFLIRFYKEEAHIINF